MELSLYDNDIKYITYISIINNNQSILKRKAYTNNHTDKTAVLLCVPELITKYINENKVYLYTCKDESVDLLITIFHPIEKFIFCNIVSISNIEAKLDINFKSNFLK